MNDTQNGATPQTGKRQNITGITLLKCFPNKDQEEAIANYRKMVGFLDYIRDIINNDDFEKCKNYNNCKKRLDDNEKPHCVALNINKFSTMMGHFDFIISIKAERLDAIEGFWLICLREASRELFGPNIISDTQTLLGVVPAAKILQNCRDYIKPILKKANQDNQHQEKQER